MTPLQEDVRKEVRRIQRFVRRAEARGYEFDDRIKNIYFNKRNASTRQLERLKKLTPEKMYERSTYSSELTYGEIVSGKKGRELERSAAAKKGQQTRQRREAPTVDIPTVDIIDIVMNRLTELPDVVHIRGKRINVQEWKSPCLTIFFQQLHARGADRYARYLLSIQERLFEIIEIIKYDSDLDRIRAAFSELATLLKGSALDFDEMVDVEESYTSFDYV